MSYLEDIQQLAIDRNVDPEKIKDDLLTVASAMGCSIEEAAHALVLALPSYRRKHGLQMYYTLINDPEPPRYFQQALDEAVEAIICAGSQMPLDFSWDIRQGPAWELPTLDEEEEQP